MNQFSSELHRLRLNHDEILDARNKIASCLLSLEKEGFHSFSNVKVLSTEMTEALKTLSITIGDMFCEEFSRDQDKK